MKNFFTKIVSKSEIKPELAHVLVTTDKLVATNSYSLIEVNQSVLDHEEKERVNTIKQRRPELSKIMIKPEELDMKIEILETMPIENGGSYPDYERVVPDDSELAHKYTAIDVDPRKLADMLLSISKTFKTNRYQSVRLFIPKVAQESAFGGGSLDGKVVVKRLDNSVIGIVMPLRTNENS